ncbi:MAG: 4a-hydroxytetrahydrobiopterin dehydratase [bacterium]
MPAPKLSTSDIAERMKTLDGWTLTDNKIARTVRCDSFNAAIALINRIAPLADDADHHPEIFNVYDRVELVLTTHDRCGLTEKDFSLAAQINGVI